MLILGNCLDVLPTLPAASVDLIFADLPYGTTDLAWDKRASLPLLWDQFLRVGKMTCTFVFTATQPFATDIIASNRKHFRYELIWHKSRSSSFLHAKHRPMMYHENVLIFCRTKTVYNPQMVAVDGGKLKYKKPSGRSESYSFQHKASVYDGTKRHPKSILPFSQPRPQDSLHPAQKPVKLLEWLIASYTNEADSVLDPTCGSGTTAIAAINMKRAWICIEQSPEHHATALERIQKHEAERFVGMD